tara:strand:- start:19934 stop:20467 length:534 start_codon:yes stop_codon:yes gene_type:complete
MAGMTVATTAAKAVGERKNQIAMKRFEDETTKRTVANAAKSRHSDMVALDQRARQNEEAARLELMQDARRRQEIVASSATASQRSGTGESGLSELSTTLSIQAGESAAARTRSLSWESQQVARSMEKVEANYQNRINSRYRPGIPGVDLAGILGGLAGAAKGYFAAPDSFDKLWTEE